MIQAAQALRYTEEKATVILVSDGQETCEMDPCQVGRDLEAAGVDFTAHVIGFDVANPGAQAQLSCLAEHTGGEFHLAENVASLSGAMRRTVEMVRSPTPPVSAVEIIEASCSFIANRTEASVGVGSSHVVSCPAGCDSGSIWGTEVYTGDSRICRAAQHAGHIDAQGGLVGVVLEKGRPAYRGSHRHGIQSSDYGKYGSSFRFTESN